MSRSCKSLAILGLLFLTSCASPALAQQEFPPPRYADEHIVLRTNFGDLVLALYRDVAPEHVQQVVRLARMGVYDSTPFRTIRSDFVLHLENWNNRARPLSVEQRESVHRLKSEFSTERHRPGVLSMARYPDDVDSAESSFSIVLNYAPQLDGQYTIFGELEWGWPAIHAMLEVPTDNEYRPLTPIFVNEALVRSADEVRQMLANGSLRGPQTARSQGDMVKSAMYPTIVCIAIMALLGIACWVATVRGSPRTAASMAMLLVLVAGVSLLIVLGPDARTHPLLGIGMFFGMLALFRFMNRFETLAFPSTSAVPRAPAAANAGRQEPPLESTPS